MNNKLKKAIWYAGCIGAVAPIMVCNQVTIDKGQEAWLDEQETDTTQQTAVAVVKGTCMIAANAVCTIGGSLLTMLVYAATVGNVIDKKLGIDWD